MQLDFGVDMRISAIVNRSAVLLSLGLLVASCALPGSIDRGRKFGVEVGMPSAEARAILERRGLRRVNTHGWSNPGCGGHTPQRDEDLEMFAERNDQGVICLFTASDRVVAIAWDSPFF
jgi:hypothetical protein